MTAGAAFIPRPIRWERLDGMHQNAIKRYRKWLIAEELFAVTGKYGRIPVLAICYPDRTLESATHRTLGRNVPRAKRDGDGARLLGAAARGATGCSPEEAAAVLAALGAARLLRGQQIGFRTADVHGCRSGGSQETAEGARRKAA